MSQATQYLDRYRIQAGVWPALVSGTGVDSHRRYYELIWNEGGGHGVELLAVRVPEPGDPAKKLLDLRVRIGQCSLEKEAILQKDSRLPAWRSACIDYSIADSYFYKTADKIYVVCFLLLTLGVERPYQRVMCVTGDITQLWEAALRYEPDFNDGGY